MDVTKHYQSHIEFEIFLKKYRGRLQATSFKGLDRLFQSGFASFWLRRNNWMLSSRPISESRAEQRKIAG